MFIVGFLFACSATAQVRSALDSLGIDVRGASREFAFTNTRDAVFYGETNGPARSAWQGFSVFARKLLADYRVTCNGQPLDRSTAVATVFPDFLRRTYPGGIVEELHPMDTLACFAVMLESPRPASWGIEPVWADSGAPNHVVVKLSPPGPLKSFTALVAAGDERAEADSLASRTLRALLVKNGERRARMEHLLAASSVRTGDQKFDRALAWAKLSLDALIMHQRTKGIFAGLPWFNNYWGRDTFIALPGATLVTGQFRTAKEILRSFAAFQNRDSLSRDEGRIPNFVSTTDTAYNTADGTPRFVMMVQEYLAWSGDNRFLLEMYPVVIRAIDGTIRKHTDSLGFLVHGDQETWMDAVGPEGPYSPRGNRANDIQALWDGQLEAGIAMATSLGDVASARAWTAERNLLRRNFARFFVTPGGIADRISADGRADMHLRPNQIFTARLLDDRQRAAMASRVVSRLTYPYGVASLWQDDPGFHRYHQEPSLYPKDAAYHNGTVWTWLQGPVLSELCRYDRQDLAFTVTSNSVHQILDRGAVGTLSELLDAGPRPGAPEPALSGAFSQAWSLAEFIRNFYEDYLGVRLDLTRGKITITPHLPSRLGHATARINLDGPGFVVTVRGKGGEQEVRVSSGDMRDTLRAEIALRSNERELRTVRLTIMPHCVTRVILHNGTINATRNGSALRVTDVRTVVPRDATLSPAMTLAHPPEAPTLPR
jgi:glycogen debranching enzyme